MGWFILAAAVSACALLHMRLWLSPNVVPVDFSPFYCAGKVALMRQDPYRVEPLRSCEAALTPRDSVQATEARSFVAPAPLPPYDFVPLALLALLPLGAAKAIFGAQSLAAVVVTGLCLARLARLPNILAVSVAYFAMGYESTALGQMSPLAIAFIASAAVAIRSGRSVFAVAALGGAMLQPQIAAFSLAAFLFLVPSARWSVVAVIAGLGMLSFGALGTRAFEYLAILPLHSATQTLAGGQYSVAAFLATIGIESGVALKAGTVWSICALGLVLYILQRDRRSALASGAIVTLPAAFAALGGTFIHATQIGVALLAAVTLARPTARAWFVPAAALGALVIPFAELQYAGFGVETVLVYGLALVCAFLLMVRFGDRSGASTRAAAVCVLLGAYIVLMAVFRPPTHPIDSATLTADDPQMFASAANLRYSQLYDAANVNARYRVYYSFLRLPTWFALIVVAGTSTTAFLRLARSRVPFPGTIAAASAVSGEALQPAAPPV